MHSHRSQDKSTRAQEHRNTGAQVARHRSASSKSEVRSQESDVGSHKA